jgi:hypothetical protein
MPIIVLRFFTTNPSGIITGLNPVFLVENLAGNRLTYGTIFERKFGVVQGFT